MSATKILGGKDTVVTSISQEASDRNVEIVTVEGLYSFVKGENPRDYLSADYELDSSTCATTGDGMGKLTIRGVKYANGDSFNAERTTFRVDMLEVTYDLQDHPYLETVRDKVMMWLATDETNRYNAATDKYTYTNKEGTLVEIQDAPAIKFCKAYLMSGIKTFNRYYPVIEKISIYKNPPGLSRSGCSFTSGSPTFSTVGKYENPPLSLNGYTGPHWFKSKDSWVQNADTTWTRTEQWTYTPETSSGQNGWIYTQL